MSNQAFQWKKIFNSDLPRKVHYVTYNRKTKNFQHPTLLFNNILLKNYMFHKHLELTLKLNFFEKDHLLSTYAKFSENPPDRHTYVSFSENFAYVINE